MNNIAKLYKIGAKIDSPKNMYRLYITCDANDADYVKDTLDISENWFNDNLLFQYVLSYVARGYNGKFGNYRDMYGHHIFRNEHFKWLHDYCALADLLLFAGTIDDYCHSIFRIKMTYFDNEGIEHIVEIPDFDKLFNTIEEAQEVMNTLYETEKNPNNWN